MYLNKKNKITLKKIIKFLYKKFLSLLLLFLVLIGCIFALFSQLQTLYYTSFGSKLTQGIIYEINNYKASSFIKYIYTIDNKEYKNSFPVFSSLFYKIGEKIYVQYNINKPNYSIVTPINFYFYLNTLVFLLLPFGIMYSILSIIKE